MSSEAPMSDYWRRHEPDPTDWTPIKAEVASESFLAKVVHLGQRAIRFFSEVIDSETK